MGKEMLDIQTSGFEITMLLEKAQKGMKADSWFPVSKCELWLRSDKPLQDK